MLAILSAVLFSILYYLFAIQPSSRKPVHISFADVRVSSEKPRVYETVELEIRLNGSISNPFDENEVNITSEIVLPNGSGACRPFSTKTMKEAL